MALSRRFAIGIVALLGLGFAVVGHPAWPQAARTIKIVISVPPGGTIDLLLVNNNGMVIASKLRKVNFELGSRLSRLGGINAHH
jgi:hypothetical protein